MGSVTLHPDSQPNFPTFFTHRFTQNGDRHQFDPPYRLSTSLANRARLLKTHAIHAFSLNHALLHRLRKVRKAEPPKPTLSVSYRVGGYLPALASSKSCRLWMDRNFAATTESTNLSGSLRFSCCRSCSRKTSLRSIAPPHPAMLDHSPTFVTRTLPSGSPRTETLASRAAAYKPERNLLRLLSSTPTSRTSKC